MMCEHEITQEEWIVEVCQKCGKLQQEINLEQQLAAANARVEELEYKLMAQTETALQEKAKREQAEAQCAAMRSVIEYLLARYKLCVQILPNGAWLVENRKEASEFAALEEKP